MFDGWDDRELTDKMKIRLTLKYIIMLKVNQYLSVKVS